MHIRMKETGEVTGRHPEWLARRLVRVGLAEEVGDHNPEPQKAEEPIATMNMLRRDLVAIAEERGIAIESDDNKASIIAKIETAHAG